MFDSAMFNNIGEHIIFVVGRGHSPVTGGFNIPENPTLRNFNVVYVDVNPNTKPDIAGHIQNLNFNALCPNIPNTKIFFLFDWSTFYCNAMDSLKKIAKRFNMDFDVYVPLGSNENTIPSEVEWSLSDHIFNVTIEFGKYPLFNWDKNMDKFNNGQNSTADIINENAYMVIEVRPKRKRALY